MELVGVSVNDRRTAGNLAVDTNRMFKKQILEHPPKGWATINVELRNSRYNSSLDRSSSENSVPTIGLVNGVDLR